jgi:odorant receptor
VATSIYGEVRCISCSQVTALTWESFLSRFPFDNNYFPVYQIVFVVISYALFVVILPLVGIDGILFGFCLYIAGQFQIVEQAIIHLTDFNDDDIEERNKKIRKSLIEIVRHHNECIELTKKVSRMYEIIVITNFTLTSLVMGMCSLTIIIAEGMEKLIFISYSVGAVLQIFLFCKNGSTLEGSSAKIAVAIYNFEWYKCDKQIKYLILTILMRSQRTAELQIPFFPVSMETFTRVSESEFAV